MQDITKFVGLDVSKETIAVAIADAGREAPRYWGAIPNTPEAIRNLIERFAELRFCCLKKKSTYLLQMFNYHFLFREFTAVLLK